MTLDVLHVDNHLLAVAKPAGTPCVPDESGDESLLDRAREWVRAEFSKPGNVFLGVVHRLDRPVSGVVLFARTSKGAARLTRQFAERTVRKTYLGVVDRAPASGREGTVEHFLRKDPATRRVAVCPEGAEGAKRAETRWRVLVEDARGALLELEPRTGRPHQLRVACRVLGTPLRGDLKYGASAPLPDRSIALHAAALVVQHPTRDERVMLEAPPPALGVWDLAR